jgi:hypothetical protein
MMPSLFLFKELLLGLKPKGIKASLFAITVISFFLTLCTILMLAWNFLGMSRDNILYAVFKERPSEELPDKLEDLLSSQEQLSQPPRIATCDSLQNCTLPEEVRRAVPAGQTSVSYFKIIVKTPQDITTIEEYLKLFENYFTIVNPEQGSLRQALAQSVSVQNISMFILIFAFSISVAIVVTAFRTIEKEWAPELESLYFSGVHTHSLRLPFFFMGILWGTISGFLALLLFYLLQLGSIPYDSFIRHGMPDFVQTDFLAQLLWRLFGLGILSGTLIGGIAAFGIKLKPH